MNQPINKNQAMNNNMNNMTSDYYHNNVKFTGRVVESPDEVITTLIYFAVLVMMALNAWPN